eukprot:TRINITY_DN264_c0_g1_i4.p1 TRINITY_DN264_c0_g1~~TRINITY_DN264_c0_g1_i4.p1  ORF type:complete len:605 (+),score=125.90 TRINITY_DN264_c0_g1_i4:54-1868(+)
MHEEIPLNPGGTSGRSRRALYLWWGLNISLVLFVFLAFVFSAASLAQMETVEHSIITNNLILNGGLVPITRSYAVTQGQNVAKGSVTSFTYSGDVAQGLGPRWQQQSTFAANASASHSDVTQLFYANDTGPHGSVYAYVPSNNPSMVTATIIVTLPGENITFSGSISLTVQNNATIEHVQVAAIGQSYFVVLYTFLTNATGEPEPTWYTNIVLGSIIGGLQTVYFGTPQTLMFRNELYVIDMLVINDEQQGHFSESIIQFASGSIGGPCEFKYFQVSAMPVGFKQVTLNTNGFGFTCSFPLASTYLSGGYFMMANQQTVGLAQATWDTNDLPSISPFGQIDFSHMYESIHLTPVGQGFVVISGIQQEGLEGPVIMTQVVEYRSQLPFLKVNWPMALIPSIPVQAYRHHIRATWVPPMKNQPDGVLVFTYVDAWTNLTTIIRGSLDNWSAPNGDTFYYIMGGARVLVSTVPYTNTGFFNHNPRPDGPLIWTASEKICYIYQGTSPSTINSFIWQGGFRIAGVAQANAQSGQSVNVTRFGSVPPPGNFPLLTGFSYYPANDGSIRSSLSVNDVFTSNGYPYRLGVAISDTAIHLDDRVVNRINDGY